MKRCTLCGVTLMMVAGCSSGPTQSAGEEGFTLLQYDATTLEATYVEGGASVHLTALESAPDVVELTYDFGSPVIAFNLDFGRGAGEFVPSGEPLDAAQARLMGPLYEHVLAVIPQDEGARTRVDTSALRQTSFMQIVPVGELLSSHEIVSERGWVHISCTCGRQYIGSGYYRTAGRGCSCTGGSGNGCKGRCGQGCGITSTPRCIGSTAYTQDCAKHDYGLGSFAAASDDYSFASNNCSCSGVGTCY